MQSFWRKQGFEFNIAKYTPKKMELSTIIAFVSGSALTILLYQVYNYAKRANTPTKEPINNEEDAWDPVLKDYLPKTWNVKSLPISDELTSDLQNNPIKDTSKLYPISQLADILMNRVKNSDKIDDFATGYGFDHSGTLHIHLNTYFPDCEPRYLDFWFRNMCNGKGRYHWYKWWHPIDHIKAWYEPNETHPIYDTIHGIYGHSKHVYEYLGKETGAPMDYILIQFVEPSEVGFKKEDYSDINERFIICIRVGIMQFQADAGYLVHFVERLSSEECKKRGIESGIGCVMKSRWFMGCNATPRDNVPAPLRWIIQGLYGIPSVKKGLLPPDLAKRIMIHGNREMNHLATFLPELYQLYHKNLENNLE